MADLNSGLCARDKNGKPMADGRVDAAFGGLYIDDATGFVSASTPTAAVVKASPVLVGRLNNVGAIVAERVATTDGLLTIQRPGDYEFSACGDMLSGNSAVAKIELLKNGAVITDAAGFPGGSVRADLTFAGTAVKMSWAICGAFIPDLKFGDTVSLAVTSNVGTVTIKVLRATLRQVSDINAPSYG